MPQPIRLRAWQGRALEQWTASRSDFLTVATPGAGKTTFSLVAALRHLSENPDQRLVVVAPTRHLTEQWADAAERFGLRLDPEWSPKHGAPAEDFHGVVVTYQQIAANPEGHVAVAHRSLVILDEVHHAGDDRAWGDGLRTALGRAERRLMLSGTPFRSDTSSIPFVTYENDEAVADFSYGYGEALRGGGVVRPVVFKRVGGEMEWVDASGNLAAASFDDFVDQAAASQRLRTALEAAGEWLPEVLRRADVDLGVIRETHPDAGGLAIAMDVDHAHAIAKLLKRVTGRYPAIATSDDPRASEYISDFADSKDRWIVAVRMISEGVDIPRLRVGVFATNVVTELFFRQAVGRFVRWSRGIPDQRAVVYIPDDMRLTRHAATMTEERVHSLKRRERDIDEMDELERANALQTEPQPSLFAALSATVSGEERAVDWGEPGEPTDVAGDELGDAVLFHLPAAPARIVALPPGPDLQPAGSPAGFVSTHQRRKELRTANSDRVRALTTLTGRTAQAVNAELNKKAGIKAVGNANIIDLTRRLQHADRWLKSI